MGMMGELSFFPSLQIKQTSQRSMIFQEKYIKELLKKFNLGDAKPIDTPIGTSSKMDVDEPCPLIN